jgi:fructose-1,6-bisphosphatase/inositol monophosphatase family enzyme
VLGVLYVPRTDEMYSCDRTGPAFYGSRPVRGVLTPETVDERTFLCATSEAHRGWDVRFPGKVRSLGSTALHVALVARGAAVGSMLKPAPWDVAAVAPILRRSGGDLFDAGTGKPLDFAAWTREGGDTRHLLACAPASLEPLRGFVVRKKR